MLWEVGLGVRFLSFLWICSWVDLIVVPVVIVGDAGCDDIVEMGRCEAPHRRRSRLQVRSAACIRLG
jgi:hypothetical protein